MVAHTLGLLLRGHVGPRGHICLQKLVKAALRTCTGDRALRLGQKALDQDIWRQIWRAHLRVPETHTLPLSAQGGGADITKGPATLRAPGHCIDGWYCRV